MRYKNIVKARFLSRPNRFIAICEINGREEVCHVKNTGRCRELLIKGAEVYLEKSDNPMRKTAYDLVIVNKNGKLINIDSYAPNIAFGEFLKAANIFDSEIIKSECKYKNSRFDFYVKEKNGYESFVEVKGVTLENDGVVMFPDAPTERGIKHIFELISAVKEGYGGYIAFVIQLKGAKYFTPNKKMHPEFSEALLLAKQNGVTILAYDCIVTQDSMTIDSPVKIIL